MAKKPTFGKKVNRATEVMNSPMGKAFQSAQGPVDYPGPGASPKARRTQSARMTAQANRGSATENLARRIKTDAARKKPVADFKRDTIRKTVDTGVLPTPGNIKKTLEVVKAQVSPSQSTKPVSKKLLETKVIITKPYKGAGSQASKKKK